jgi:hypothetical protein
VIHSEEEGKCKDRVTQESEFRQSGKSYSGGFVRGSMKNVQGNAGNCQECDREHDTHRGDRVKERKLLRDV